MADKRKAPVAPEGALRRKRAAPTIDLTATELPPVSESGGPPSQAVPDPSISGPPVSDPAPPHQAAHEATEMPLTGEPPPRAAGEPSAPNRAAEEPVAAHPGGGNGLSIATLASGIIGAAIVAFVVAALWFGGVLPVSTGVSTNVSAQLAALQKQIQELQSRPGARGPLESQSIEALSQRVGKIENMLARLPTSGADVAQRLTADENTTKSLGVALAALNKRSDDIAADATRARVQAEAAANAVTQLRATAQSAAKDASAAVAPEQFDALQQRLSALERSTKVAREEIAKATAAEKSTRQALGAAALRAAVVRGAPFAAELAQAKSLGADDRVLAPLMPFAAAGVPSAAMLAQELRALIPAIRKAAGAPAASGGFLQQLQANASKLVRIQPITAPPGDDPSAVLARLDDEAARADIAGALADLAKLPEPTRAPVQDWIEKAHARQAALAAAQRFAADAARRLGQE